MNIVVYGKPDCIQCHWTRKELDKMELIYEYIDVTIDRDAARDVNRMGYTAMPVVVVSNSRRVEKWAGLKLDRLRLLKETSDWEDY